MAQAQSQIDPRLTELHARILSSELGPINSLLILQGDELIHESYYQGAHAHQPQRLFSVTKSVGATLIGMAERNGLLAMDAPVPIFFPDYDWQQMPYIQNAGLRLHDLLTMRHGLDWDEWTFPYFDPRNSHTQMSHADDWYQFTVSRPRVGPVDSVFAYSTGVSNLMSGILRQVSGKSPEQVFIDWLASPLGFGPHDWAVTIEVPPPWILVRDFPHGDAPMGDGLWLRPRDLLQLGKLYLNRGRLGDQRLLDEDWIWRSWTPWSHAGNDPGFRFEPEPNAYGYQWWFVEFMDAGGRRIPSWYAAGSARQYLFVFPTLDLVVVSTSLNVLWDGPGIGLGLREYILPLFEPVSEVELQISGPWYDPASPGQGFNFQNHSSGLLGYYYGYSAGQPLWLVFPPVSEPVVVGRTLELQAFAPSQGVFGAPVSPNDGGVSEWGVLRLRFDACTRAHAVLEGETGVQEFQLHLLAELDGLDSRNCTEPVQARPMSDASGAWYDVTSDGQGWNLFRTPIGMSGYFYGYSQAGDPLWLVIAQPFDVEPGDGIQIDLLAGQGGEFDQPVPPEELTHWGTLDLEFSDCRNAQAFVTGIDGSQAQSLVMLANIPGVPACSD